MAKGQEQDHTDSWNKFFALLRDIRVDCQTVLSLAAAIQDKARLKDATVRKGEVTALLQTSTPIFESNRDKVKKLIGQIRTLLDTDSLVYNWDGDLVAQIENFFEQGILCWPKPDAEVDQVMIQLDELSAWLDKIIWNCALVTIPPRVQDHLDGMRVGRALNFEREFKDELSDPKERTEMLQYLFDHPKDVDGVVDVARGIIFKASRDPAKQRWSLARILGVVFLGGLLTALADHFVPRPLQSPLTNLVPTKTLVGCYFCVMLGSAAHLAVEALKQKRAATDTTFLAIEDWILWVHVREASIITGVLTLWLGLVGLTVMKQGAVSWQASFLVGYSIDSFMELFLQRFEKVVSLQTDTLKKDLQPEDKS